MWKLIFISVVGLCLVAGTHAEGNDETDDDPIAIQPRGIVGGTDADIENHKYQVAILLKRQLHCGGTIIHPNWVLTAAHCCVEMEGRHSVLGLRPSQISLRVGSTRYNSGGSVYFLDKMFYHRNYKKKSGDFDICVMRTTHPILYSATVAAISLANEGEAYPVGTHATVSGWGHLGPSFKGDSDVLQTVKVPVISEHQCRQSYRRLNLEDQITERQVCAGSPQGGKDACQGDSGGPMVIHGKLVGVTNWGKGCGDPLFPGVYANVANFRSWIRRTTGV